MFVDRREFLLASAVVPLLSEKEWLTVDEVLDSIWPDRGEMERLANPQVGDLDFCRQAVWIGDRWIPMPAVIERQMMDMEALSSSPVGAGSWSRSV